MTSRIETTFETLHAQKRAALIPFIMGYDPDAAATSAILDALPGAGADLIEIGIPFSDPVADGSVIQAAGLRALAAGATLGGILELVRNFRRTHAHTPIILMGYFNPVYRYGNEKFCHAAVEAGVDGIIIVDLPPEEEQEIRPYLTSSGLKLIRLIAPTSDNARIALLTQSASGFVYYISIAGITGAAIADVDTLAAKLAPVRKATDLPIAVGFGIKTADQVRQFAPHCDAVVVGSALVDRMSRHKGAAIVKSAADFVSELATGLKR